MPALTSTLDWAKIGFGVRDVNGHVEATWKDGQWSKPEFVQEPYLRIHGFAR